MEAIRISTERAPAPGGWYSQAYMQAILEEAGSDLAHIIKTMVFVKDIEDFAKFNEAYKKFFPNNPPARSTMQVGNFLGDMVIEIEAIATEK